MAPKPIGHKKPRPNIPATSAVWIETQLGTGNNADARRIMIPVDSQYPNAAGVSFYKDDVFNRTDLTGPREDSEFHFFPAIDLVGGEVLLATWTDENGVSRSSTYNVPTPTPITTATADGNVSIAANATGDTLVPPSGWPDATNTGPTGTLTPYSGTYTVTTNNATIQDLHITGKLVINASNVTVSNCKITNTTNKYCVELTGSGHLIEDCEIDGNNWSTHGIVFAGYTIRRCNIHHVGDGLRIGTNTTVEDCWIHDLSHNGLIEPSPHYDAIQSLGGYNQVIRGNNLVAKYRGQTSVILWFAFGLDLGSGNIIENNRLSGGGYSLYIYPFNGPDGDTYNNNPPSPYNITAPQIVRNNTFVRHSAAYAPLGYETYIDTTGVLRRFPPMPSPTWRPPIAAHNDDLSWQSFSNNVYDTGGAVYPGMGYDIP